MSNGEFSNRHSLPAPGHGHPDTPIDGETAARSFGDPDDVGWTDLIQTLILADQYLDGKLVDSGSLGARPNAGGNAPKLYVVTDDTTTNGAPYLCYNDDSQWIDQKAPMEPHGTTLHGSDDAANPRSGLADAMLDALDDDLSYLYVTGAWTMDRGINAAESSALDASDYPRVGITIDCSQGAYIEYSGSGFVFEHISDSEPGQALDGEIFQIHGGTWEATGTPDGFVRLEDTSHAQLYPVQTRNFSGASGGSAIYQVDLNPVAEDARWAENNNFGGRHHIIDNGIRDNGNGNSVSNSFQDNYVDDIHFSGVQEYGFDLSGNWIDSKFENPTVIVSGEDAAALRLNGNLDGTTLDNLEIEDASSTLSNYYVIEIGPDAAGRGPVFQGMKTDYNRENEGLSFINDTNAPSNWVVWINETSQSEYNRYCFSDSGHSRLRMTPTGFFRDTASDPDGPWTQQGSF